MSFDVWMPGAEDEAFLGPLRAALVPEVRLHVDDTAPDAPVRLLVRGVPSAEQLDALEALATVVIPYAGVPEATRELLEARPRLALHNLHHNAAPTAEMAIALMLAAVKRVVPHDRDLRRGDWRRLCLRRLVIE